jgi:cephalosporin-C deacetylase
MPRAPSAAARSHPAVDARRIAARRRQPGGGIALAAAGLVPDVSAVLPDVPSCVITARR